jgi:hypothetical protein
MGLEKIFCGSSLVDYVQAQTHEQCGFCAESGLEARIAKVLP